MNTYVAFQLGINVGKRQVKMAKLKELLEKAGYTNVRTLLASGNVVFDTDKNNPKMIADRLHDLLTEAFGFEIKNIVRTIDEIKQLIARDPFKTISVTPATRLYVTFLTDPVMTDLDIPYESENKTYRILQVTDKEVVSVLTVTKNWGSTDAMAILSKTFGKKFTTRNWNTILKIASLGEK
jgi:uncharacterized protein (DUF1697 family)